MCNAAILAVGTELTTGQITNRNASWLSEKLTALGVNVALHETVPDDRKLILGALKRCAEVARVVFVTGGLGPTTDDFTREVIAEWCGKPLQYQSKSWDTIHARLTRFGVAVAESNRQQCYFPEGAEVLTNPEGTAAGFFLEHEDALVWVLPGPPREVEAVWDSSGAQDLIRSRFPTLKATKLFTWQCMGKSEAELGQITERALAGSGLATGYRAHRPFVEVKVWCEQAGVEAARPWLAKLEAEIAPWVATRDGQDLAELLLNKISGFTKITVIDAATQGLVTERIAALLRSPQHKELAACFEMKVLPKKAEHPIEFVRETLERADPRALTLVIAGFRPDGTGAFGTRVAEKVRTEEARLPYSNPELIDRLRAMAAEVALQKWRSII